MNPPLRAFALVAACCLSAAVAAQPATSPRQPIEIDRVVAVVNTDVITLLELEARRLAVERQLRQRRIEVPPADELRRQVLERMITDRAAVQAAREAGLRVDDAQLDRELARLAEDNRLTPAQLRAQVERDGIAFARFREDLRDEMLISRLRSREIEGRLQVSEADVDAFLAEQRQAAGTVAPEYLLSHILLRVPEGASAAQIERQRLRGEEILRQLERGGDFARLSAAFSDAPEAMSGGNLGWRAAERLPQLFLEAVESLKPGDPARLLRSPNGFHVLRLDDRRAGGGTLATAPVLQTRARHILMRPSEITPQADVLRRLAEVRERLIAGRVEFADMARQYSVDGSASRGGDLGWLLPGDTVSAFERAMNALKPGEISEPVRSEFGYHLIQVLERRTEVATVDRQRQAARGALRERRIEEETQDWLRQLRDRAFVEYRDR
jgi:peptidyl-prolyl cis-trans isomerase SurA